MNETTIIQPERVFMFGTLRLQDPDPKATPDEVRDVYAVSYPSLHAHTTEGPEIVNDQLVYTFKKPDVKTKGA